MHEALFNRAFELTDKTHYTCLLQTSQLTHGQREYLWNYSPILCVVEGNAESNALSSSLSLYSFTILAGIL